MDKALLAPLDKFCVVVISLRDALLRRDSMSEQLKHLAIDFEFFDAVDGRAIKSLPYEYDSRSRLRNYGYDLSLGEIGCFLSHRTVWQRCQTTGIPHLIMEDDIKLTDNFKEALDTISRIKRFDLLRLSGLTERVKSQIHIERIGPWSVVEELKDPGGSGAYVLFPSGAKKLLAHSERFHEPLDNFLEKRWLTSLDSLALRPYPVIQNVFPSMIHDRVGSSKGFIHRIRRLFFRSAADLRRLVWASWRRLNFWMTNALTQKRIDR